MSLYADYIHEKTKDFIIENDKGFATYRFLEGFKVYIVDIYVKPEFRKQGVAQQFINEIVEKAVEIGCTELYGSVNVNFANPTYSVKLHLAYGMEVFGLGPDIIIFRKAL